MRGNFHYIIVSFYKSFKKIKHVFFIEYTPVTKLAETVDGSHRMMTRHDHAVNFVRYFPLYTNKLPWLDPFLIRDSSLLKQHTQSKLLEFNWGFEWTAFSFWFTPKVSILLQYAHVERWSQVFYLTIKNLNKIAGYRKSVTTVSMMCGYWKRERRTSPHLLQHRVNEQRFESTVG